jgi:hypothetical protein
MILRRAATVLVGLYPRAWRARYGGELRDVLASHRISPRTLADLVVSALDASLDPDYRWRGAVSMTRLRPSAVALVSAIPLFLAGFAAWYVIDEPLPSRVQVNDPLWQFVDWVVPLSAMFVLVALSAAAGAASVALARRRGRAWAVYALLGVLGVFGPAGYVLMFVFMNPGPDHEYAILGVLGPGIAVATVLLAALRLRLDGRVAIVAALPVAMLAFVLLAAAIAVGAYGADLLVHGVPLPIPAAPTAPLPAPYQGWLAGWLVSIATMGVAALAACFAIIRAAHATWRPAAGG